MGRFKRLIVEMEIEVTDEVDLAVGANDFGHDEAGNVGMVNFSTDQRLQNVVSQAVAEGLMRTPGVRFMGASAAIRREKDGRYIEHTVGSLPVRREDGTYPES